MATVYMNDAGSGYGSADCTATDANVLYGKTAIVSGSSDEPTPGTMKNHAGQNDVVELKVTSTPSGQFYMKVPENGYYTTDGRLQTVWNNVGTAQTSHVLTGQKFTSRYGINLDGGMTDNSGQTKAGTLDVDSSKVRLKVQTAGYYDTTSYLNASPNSSLGDATQGQVYPGKYFTSSAGAHLVGTMPEFVGQIKDASTVSTGNGYLRLRVPEAGYYGNNSYLQTDLGNLGDAVATNVLKGKKFSSTAGRNVTGTLEINSVVSFSVARNGNNSVKFTIQIPTGSSGSGRPWSGLYVRGKVGGYPTSRSEGFFVNTYGTGGEKVYTNTTNLPDGATIYFRGWDYINYDTDGSGTYGSRMFGSSHDAGSVLIDGYASITSSGTWTVPSGANRVEFFAVGGGGGSTYTKVTGVDGSGGGGGGYTARSSQITTSAGSKFTVVVGSGGKYGDAVSYSQYTEATNGSESYVKNSGGTTLVTAAGGYASSGYQGGSGGSGGGGGADGGSDGTGGDGGTNGGNGSYSSDGSRGGNGQGTSTTFNGVTYSGGGGGGGSIVNNSGGKGGTRGGGNGAYGDWGSSYYYEGSAGSANSGGGGGGESGDARGGAGHSGGSGAVIVHYWKA